MYDETLDDIDWSAKSSFENDCHEIGQAIQGSYEESNSDAGFHTNLDPKASLPSARSASGRAAIEHCTDRIR